MKKPIHQSFRQQMKTQKPHSDFELENIAFDTYSSTNQNKIENALLNNSSFTTLFTGQHFEDKKLIKKLMAILDITIILTFLTINPLFIIIFLNNFLINIHNNHLFFLK